MKKIFSKGRFHLLSKKYFSRRENPAMNSLKNIPSVTIVRTEQDAKRVVSILKSKEFINRFHAWDTETLGIDPKEQSPVGNGRVMCFTCFAGADINFGNGPSKNTHKY
jgi:DNA polymerase-1